MLYGKSESDTPSSDKEIETNKSFSFESTKPGEVEVDRSLDSETKCGLGDNWTLLQTEDVKTPSHESLHTISEDSRNDDRQMESDLLCKNCEWPKSEDYQVVGALTCA